MPQRAGPASPPKEDLANYPSRRDRASCVLPLHANRRPTLAMPLRAWADTHNRNGAKCAWDAGIPKAVSLAQEARSFLASDGAAWRVVLLEDLDPADLAGLVDRLPKPATNSWPCLYSTRWASDDNPRRCWVSRTGLLISDNLSTPCSRQIGLSPSYPQPRPRVI